MKMMMLVVGIRSRVVALVPVAPPTMVEEKHFVVVVVVVDSASSWEPRRNTTPQCRDGEEW